MMVLYSWELALAVRIEKGIEETGRMQPADPGQTEQSCSAILRHRCQNHRGEERVLSHPSWLMS
jgi:hypothetical protein